MKDYQNELSFYLVGSYIYHKYSENYKHINMTGDRNTFFYVLGWHINQSFPDAYIQIHNTIITQ
jgi:hypothetical protein